MNFTWFFRVIFIHLCYELTTGKNSINWERDIREMNATLLKISEGMGKVLDQIDYLKIALQLVNSKLENNKKRLEAIESNVRDFSETCSSTSKMLDDKSVGTIDESLSVKLDNYGSKLLKEHQAAKDTSSRQMNLLMDIKDLTTSGLKKMYSKLETLPSSEETERSINEVSQTIQDLSRTTVQQEAQLSTVKGSLIVIGDSFNSLKNYTKAQITELWTNISKAIDAQKGDLSQNAAFRVTTAADTSKILKDEFSTLTDLQPRLIHVARLSEEMTTKLKDGTTAKDSLLPIASNLSSSLENMKYTLPSKILYLSEIINSIDNALLKLKSMAGPDDSSQCIMDTINEVKTHHKEIIKYLNSTVLLNVQKKLVEPDEESQKIWNTVMRRLENIEKNSDRNENVLEKLKYVSDEIRECNVALQKLIMNEDEQQDDHDTTFG